LNANRYDMVLVVNKYFGDQRMEILIKGMYYRTLLTQPESSFPTQKHFVKNILITKVRMLVIKIY